MLGWSCGGFEMDLSNVLSHSAGCCHSRTAVAIGLPTLQVDMDEECRSHEYWIMARWVEYGK